MRFSAIGFRALCVCACLTLASTVHAQPSTSPWNVETSIGWDVNLSGQFINDAIGTINGVPVIINEVSYGEVFGTGFVWQVGGGYRMNDLNEFRADFTYQDVGTDDPVLIGTAGNGVDLFATFDDYSVWSLDFGYRRYFRWVDTPGNHFRVRPYAGVALGIADIPRINGQFAAPAAGLVQSDEDLYDGTAAFTFGINGGVLTALTPKLDLKVQLGFRHVTGLADIDRFDDTSLDRINDESGRWTMPITFGVRYNF
jgi:Outer membrane protein beta-barrel domain